MRKGKVVKHSVAKRLVVGLLSVVLLLTACATTIPPEESEETENSRVSDAQSADAESSGPETVLPEERETVPELVATFKTGEDGLFYIASHNGGVLIPIEHRVDENGALYISNGLSVTRVSDGKQVRGQHGWNTAAFGSDLLVKGELLYILYNDGFVEVCSMDDERVYTLYDLSDVADLFKLEPDGNVRYTEFRVLPDGEVIVIAASKAGRFCYRLDGTQLTAEEAAEVFLTVQTQGEEEIWAVGENSLPSCLYTLEKGQPPAVMGVTNGVVCVSAGKTHEHENYLKYGSKREAVYTFYDAASGSLSRVLIRQDFGMPRASCAIPTEDGTPITEYSPAAVNVGGTLFSGLAGSDVVYGVDGNLYVVLYRERDAEVYRVKAGFTAKQFPEECDVCGENALKP